MSDAPRPGRPASAPAVAAVPLLVVLLSLALLVLAAPPASAHPLGNFTTNTSATLLPGAEVVEVIYVLDLAEIPTQQARRDIEAAGGPQEWAGEECWRIAEGQQLTIADQPRTLAPGAVAISFPAGEAGLDTLRLTCQLATGALELDGSVAMTYRDTTSGDRVGWQEVIAVGDGTTLTGSDVPAASATDQLRSYPEAEVSRVTEASLIVDLTGGAAAPASLRGTELQPVEEAAGGLEGLVERYTELIAQQTLTPGFVLLAFLLAILLGTAHAVAPGHGKTVIAAYLLGEGGQAREAVALGGTVAITHTIGVLVLGLLVQTSSTVAPESLYPILGVVGGVLFTGLGCLLLYRAITRRGHGHDHDHGPRHGHSAAHAHTSSHDHIAAHDDGHGHAAAHDHAHGAHVVPAPPRSGWRMLIVPGLAGGMVPSPSALLVLLGGIALGRTWFGVLLVIAYGLGMALALVGAGYLLHRMRFRVMERLEGDTWARISTALPVVTSMLIVVGGLVIIGRSVLTA